MRTDKKIHFMHIPKTGGISLVNFLEKQFKASEICPYFYLPGTADSIEWIKTRDVSHNIVLDDLTDEKLKSYKFFNGHLGWLPRTIVPAQEIETITFLRDPIERVLSVYNYLKGNLILWDKSLSKWATFKDFVFDPMLPAQLSDLQTKSFCSDKFLQTHLRLRTSTLWDNVDLTENEVLDLALTRLHECSFVGLTEKYDASFEWLCNQYEWLSPKIILKQNVSRKLESKSTLDKETIDRVLELNQKDLVLYDAAQKIFAERNKTKVYYSRAELENIFTKNFPPLNRIEFTFDNAVIGEGWEAREGSHGDTFCWSAAPVATLCFSIETNKNYLLTFTVIHSVLADLPEKLSLSANGFPVPMQHRFTKDGIEFNALVSCDKLIKGHFLELCFATCEVLRPIDISPENKDLRKLGFAFKTLLIKSLSLEEFHLQQKNIHKQLHVAIWLQDYKIYAYQAKWIREILQDDRFVISYIILEAAPINNVKIQSSSSKFTKFLYGPLDAFTITDLSLDLASIPVVTRDAADIDVILDCKTDGSNERLSVNAKMGVWSFHYSSLYSSNDLPHFWELYHANATIKPFLQIETLNSCVIFREGVFKTQLENLAVTQNKIFFETAGWITSALAECWNNPSIPLSTLKLSLHPKTIKIHTWHKIIFFFKKIYRLGAIACRDFLFHTVWNVAILPCNVKSINNDNVADKAKWLPELPWPYFQADPFGVIDKDRKLLLVEKFNYKTSIGSLDLINLNENLIETNRYDLATNFPDKHHSYPYIIKENNKTYVIPECHESKNLVLYELLQNGKLLESATLLKDLPILDPTIIFYNNYYWLFCTILNPYTDGNTCLHIFYAENLKGPYYPHLLNPVKTDVRSGRPAGNFFTKNKKLYLPTQDCSKVYGGAIAIAEIETLTPTNFSEKIVDKILPQGKYKLGIHNLAYLDENLSLIDGQRYGFSLKDIFYKLTKKSKPKAIEGLRSLFDNTPLTNASEIQAHMQVHGMDLDSWCANEITLTFATPKDADKLILQIEFPAWQAVENQYFKLYINNKFLSETKVERGYANLEMPMNKKRNISKLKIRAKSQFNLPAPDERKRAFRLCEISLR